MKAATFNQLRHSTDIKFRQLPINNRRSFSGSNESAIKAVGCYEMAVTINKRDTYTPVFVLDGLNTDVILGIDFICRASKVIMGDEDIVDDFSASMTGIEEIAYSYGRTTDKVNTSSRGQGRTSGLICVETVAQARRKLLRILAITFACQQFHHYLYGSKSFQVFSDHKPLLRLNKTIHEKTMHCLKEALIPYQFDIEYRKGQDQEAADCLSRNPVDEISGEFVNFVNKDPTTIANDQKDDP